MHRPAAVAAGVALIALPLVALIVKFITPGWFLFFVFLYGIFLLLGYAVQIAIAVTGMFTARAAFVTAPGGIRGIVAAWCTSIAGVLVPFFLVDGGDSGESASPFTLLTGLGSVDGADDVSMILCYVSGLVWLATWAWLVVEWIVALIRRRHRGASQPAT